MLKVNIISRLEFVMQSASFKCGFITGIKLKYICVAHAYRTFFTAAFFIIPLSYHSYVLASAADPFSVCGV